MVLHLGRGTEEEPAEHLEFAQLFYSLVSAFGHSFHLALQLVQIQLQLLLASSRQSSLFPLILKLRLHLSHLRSEDTS